MLSSANVLLKNQFTLLQNRATRDFRALLLKKAGQSKTKPWAETADAESIKVDLGSREEQEQLLRNAAYAFQKSCSDLVGVLDIDITQIYSDAKDSLQEILDTFSDTPAARLLLLRQLDKQTRDSANRLTGSSKAKKGGKGGRKGFGLKGLNIGLNLVGMLRPPGYGNLQGFAGYATSLFGLPLDLLLGFQNDGDSPEIRGEDRELPLLRLQPKVHIDIDL